MAVRDGIVILLASFTLATGTRTNVAERKPAWMSSNLYDRHPASRAVDREKRANEDRFLTHTAIGQSSAWWKVDLQTRVQSAQVILYFRTNYKKRRNGVHLYTSGTNSSDPKEGNLCHTVTGLPDGTNIDDVLNVTCPGSWRYLTVYTDTDNDRAGPVLDFAEVQVWICTAGTYGPDCTRNCSSRHCKVFSSTCDHINGTCPAGGCQDGWMGVDCTTACGSGKYGANCTKDCSSRQCMTLSSTCDRFSGACPADRCKDGWTGVDCTTALVNCPDGKYGPGCTEFCSSRNCKTPSHVCDVTGSCTDGCREGWQNADCRIPCPSGTYGSNCSRSCDSRQCKTARTTCDHESGTCTTGCREGWIGGDCTQRCKPGTYGPDCSRCGYCDVTCNVEDGRCPGECLDGFTGDRCDVDVRDSVVKIGVIGGAIGMAVMLLLVVGLFMCLLKHERLKWIPSNGPDPKARRKKSYIEEIPAHTPTPGLENPDYAELSDVNREREEKSQYDAVQNQVYENNII